MFSKSVVMPDVPLLHRLHLRLDKAIQMLLLIFIAALPFHQLLIIQRNGFLVLLGLLLIWSAIHRRLWVVPISFDLRLLLFVAWVGITLPFASFPEYSLREFGKLLEGIAIFYAIVVFLRDGGNKQYLLHLLIFMVLVVSVAGLYQFDPGNYQATRSFLTSEVWLTTFLVMFTPLAFALAVSDQQTWSRWTYLIVAVMALACLLSTQSRAGLVALLAESWLFAWLYSKNRMVTVAVGTLNGFILLGFMLATSSDFAWINEGLSNLRTLVPVRTSVRSVEHRFDIWSFAISEISKHPIVGIGYGSETLRLLYPDDGGGLTPGGLPIRNVGTHNIFLYLALHIGIPGVLLFVWVIGAMLKQFAVWYTYSANFPSNAVLAGVMTGIVGLLIRLQFDQMFLGALALLFWVMAGLAVLYAPPASAVSNGDFQENG